MIPGSRRSLRVAEMANRVDGAQGEYILMDYCKFGNLESQLMKAAVDMPPNNTERWLPESVLWRIFDCLIKGCMAMQCPPRYVLGNGPPVPPPIPAVVVPVAAGSAAALSALSAALSAPPGIFPNAAAILAFAAAPFAVTQSTSGGNLAEVVAPGFGVFAGHRGMVHFDLVGILMICFKSWNPHLICPPPPRMLSSEFEVALRPKSGFAGRNFGRLRFFWPISLGKSIEIIKTNLGTA